MKRLLSIFLLTLYLLSSAGLTLRAHYCGGDLASLGLFSKGSCSCEERSHGKPDDCCKNEQKRISLPDEQLKAESRQLLPYFVACLAVNPGIVYAANPTTYPPAANITLPVIANNKDPIPLYKRHHSYLFYG